VRDGAVPAACRRTADTCVRRAGSSHSDGSRPATRTYCSPPPTDRTPRSRSPDDIASTLYAPHTHARAHPFNGPLSGTTPRVGRYQKGKTNLDFTEARDSEWQWHQLGHMQVWYGMVNADLYSAIITKVSNAQVCTSLQSDNHASTPPLSFLQAGCPSCRPTNSVKALKAKHHIHRIDKYPDTLLANQTARTALPTITANGVSAGWRAADRQVRAPRSQLSMLSGDGAQQQLRLASC